jgi:hypothetical protein
MISSAFELSLNVSELTYNKLATKTMNNTTAESTDYLTASRVLYSPLYIANSLNIMLAHYLQFTIFK